MAIYMWRDVQGTEDILTTETAGGKSSNTSYYFGVCFSPNKNCELLTVKFLNYDNSRTTGTLKIEQGSLATNNGTTYSVDTDITGYEYTFDTPIVLSANTDYVISFKPTTNGLGYYTTGGGGANILPVNGENITFKYSTYTINTNTFTITDYGIYSFITTV